jgi:hypothetical protein
VKVASFRCRLRTGAIAVSLATVGLASAGQVEFDALLAAKERTAERERIVTDQRELAIATMKMHQAQLFATDARAAVAEARVELAAAVASISPVDSVRLRIQSVQTRLEALAGESEAAQKAYHELLGKLKQKYKAQACEATLDLRWDCPTQMSGDKEAAERP